MEAAPLELSSTTSFVGPVHHEGGLDLSIAQIAEIEMYTEICKMQYIS